MKNKLVYIIIINLLISCNVSTRSNSTNMAPTIPDNIMNTKTSNNVLMNTNTYIVTNSIIITPTKTIPKTYTLIPIVDDSSIGQIRLSEIILNNEDIPIQDDSYPLMFWDDNVFPIYSISKPENSGLCKKECISGEWIKKPQTLMLALDKTISEEESISEINSLKRSLILNNPNIVEEETTPDIISYYFSSRAGWGGYEFTENEPCSPINQYFVTYYGPIVAFVKLETKVEPGCGGGWAPEEELLAKLVWLQFYKIYQHAD